MDKRQHEIFEKPLPQLFDELEAGLAGLKSGLAQLETGLAEMRKEIDRSKAATQEAALAAKDARRAGEDAAAGARKAAEAALADFRKDFNNTRDKFGVDLANLRAEMLDEIGIVRKIAEAALRLGKTLNRAWVAAVTKFNEEVGKEQ